jgi:hypothetical protein
MDVSFFLVAFLVWFVVSVTAALVIATILASGKRMVGDTDGLDFDDNELERTQVPAIIASSV